MSVNSTVAKHGVECRRCPLDADEVPDLLDPRRELLRLHASPGIARTSAAGILAAMYSAMSTTSFRSSCTSSSVGVCTASSTFRTSISAQISTIFRATSGVHAPRVIFGM